LLYRSALYGLVYAIAKRNNLRVTSAANAYELLYSMCASIFGPPVLKKSDEKKRGNRKENDVQNSPVIETDRCPDNLSTALRRDQPEQFEKKLD
jgi:hypothetical protein